MAGSKSKLQLAGLGGGYAQYTRCIYEYPPIYIYIHIHHNIHIYIDMYEYVHVICIYRYIGLNLLTYMRNINFHAIYIYVHIVFLEHINFHIFKGCRPCRRPQTKKEVRMFARRHKNQGVCSGSKFICCDSKVSVVALCV